VADELALAPAEGLTVVWDRDADGEDGPGWRLSGSLDGFSTLRVLTATIADGSALMLCAARPERAEHHDADAVAAAVIGADGTVQTIEEALLSTEYAADGSVTRLGLELYKPGDDYPLRAAGDVTSAGGERSELRFRLDGSEGTAIYEIVRGE
jgi:hypothetical protein